MQENSVILFYRLTVKDRFLFWNCRLFWFTWKKLRCLYCLW